MAKKNQSTGNFGVGTSWTPTVVNPAVQEWANKENTDWRLTPAARSKVVGGATKSTAVNRRPESSEEYTKRRIKEETKRTWRSDVADTLHGIGEGVLALHPYTAIPYYGAKVGQDILNGTYGWQTALNLSVPLFHLSPQAVGLREATNVALEDVANAGSKTARNWRIAREINDQVKNTNLKTPIGYNNGRSFETGLIAPEGKQSHTAFFYEQEKPSTLSRQELAGVPKQERNFRPKWHIARYPGYQLKGLMSGSPLERQISKTGTININQLNAYFNKASQIEKEIANKVLTEKFAGQKTIDYNQFKKAIQDELITYSTKPETKFSTYGMDRLGFNVIKESDGAGGIVEYLPKIRTNTFTFESPRIPIGNSKHYNATTLGHSRTYTLPGEPNVLHVMESQSDWAQQAFKGRQKPVQMNQIVYNEQTGSFENPNPIEYTKYSPQEEYLIKNYLQRQLQENLKYASEHGQTKMRYPTSDTAAKIEGYEKKTITDPKIQDEYRALDQERTQLYNEQRNLGIFDLKNDIINKRLSEIELREQELNSMLDYSPEHQTILKKYSDFPKLFQKLYKGQNVRTVTDAKGNTWYEVDVPKGYLSREWQYKQGGKFSKLEFLKQIKQGV